MKPGIEFIAPFRIYLPEEFFEVSFEGKTSVVKPSPLPPIYTIGTQPHGSNIEISHDIFGYAGRTHFSVVLDEEIEIKSDNWKNEFLENEGRFINLAITFVNRMLEIYRDQDRNNLDEKSFHIIPLVKTDIYDIRLFAIDENLKEVDGFVVRKPSFHRVGFGNAVHRKPEITAEIKKWLKDGISLPIYRELMNSSLNYIWRGQYRLVPVEANTALESFIPEIIYLLNPNINRSELGNLYDKLLKLEGVLSTLLLNSGFDSLSWFSKPSDGWKTLVQSELKEWYDDCYSIRNRVIHEGYNKVTRQEAEKAYKAALSAINYIQLEIRKIIKI